MVKPICQLQKPNQRSQGPFQFVLIVILGALNISVLLSVSASIAFKSDGGNTLLNVISIPILIPILVILISASNDTLKNVEFHTFLDCEIVVNVVKNREGKMKDALASIKDDYDFIIMDCSPSLGLITINSLTAADSVIIPVQCEYYALEGLGKLLNTIKIIQSRLNPQLVIEGILLTMYDLRLRLSNQVVNEVNSHFKNMVFETIIPRNIRLSESPSFGIPAILHDADSKGSISYLNLAKEIIRKNGLLVTI